MGSKSTKKSKNASASATATSTPGRSAVDYQKIVDALVVALGDPDERFRSAAVAALVAGRPKLSEDPLKPLIAALTADSAAVRAAAVSTLAGFPRGLDRVIPSLIKLAASEEPEIREACTLALSRIRPPAISAAAVPSLIDGLRNPDRDVQLNVLFDAVPARA